MFEACNIDDDTETEFPSKKSMSTSTDDSFKNVIPKVLNDDDFDVVILESGSIEITNININEAVMDINQDIPNLKKNWFSEVEKDSVKLFEIAEEAVEKNPDLEVIIVKRLPRHDKSSHDILNIKSRLSNYANTVYDQLLMKSNFASKIHVVELNLETQKFAFLRELVFGNQSFENFDGVHLRGKGASRHFTYRAIQVMRTVFPRRGKKVFDSFPKYEQSMKERHSAHKSETLPSEIKTSRPGFYRYDDHTDCPQAR